MNPRRLLHSLLLLTPLCALADPSATALRVPKAPTLVPSRCAFADQAAGTTRTISAR